MALIAGSCTSSNPVREDPNTSLVVTYEGKEVHRRNAKWISIDEFIKLREKDEFVMVFGADWCRSCEKLRMLIKQANLKDRVYFLNLEEPWVKSIAMETGIRNIPVMFSVQHGKATIAKIGPNDIIMWLLINKK